MNNLFIFQIILELIWKLSICSTEVVLITGTEFTFRNNTNLVHIYVPVRLINSTSGTHTVTCTLNQTTSTATSFGTFNEITLSALNPNGTMTFSCSKYGREVVFFCHLSSLYDTSGNFGEQAKYDAVTVECYSVTTTNMTVAGFQAKINAGFSQILLLLFVNGLFDDLNIICGLTIVQTTQDADNVMKTSGCTESDGTAGTWMIDPTSISFQSSTPSSQVKTLRIRRKSYPTILEAGSVEMLVVRCCNPVSNMSIDPVFGGVQASSQLNVLLKKPFVFNTGDKYPTETESSLPNPAFVNIAPCPCDLIVATCDPGCCCDPKCPVNQAVPCLMGPIGGGPVPMDPFNCTAHAGLFNSTSLTFQPYTGPNGTQSRPVRRPEMHSLFCVTKENNAALGYYYPSLGVIRNLSAWTTHLDSRGPQSRLVLPKDDGNRDVYGPNERYGYGDALRLVTEEVTYIGTNSITSTNTPKRPVLRIPSPHNCISPEGVSVRFLQEVPTYRCPILITQDTCSVAGRISTFLDPGSSPLTYESRLLGKTYLISDDVATRLSPPVYELLASLNAENSRSQTKVNYYCLSPAEMGYFTNSVKTDNAELGQLGFFDQTCQFDPTTNVTTCAPSVPASSSSGTTLAKDCPWDDGFTLVPDVSLSNETCDNAVLRVDYRFYWSEGNIPRAEADIYLASVNTSLGQRYYQSFSVRFIHRSVRLSSFSDSNSKSSGVYGYDAGAQLVTGTISAPTTSGAFSVIVDSPNLSLPGIATIQPGLGGLCGNSRHRAVRFAENSIGTCRVNLNSAHFDDCTRLRSLVKAQLDQFVSSDVIAVYGSPSISTSSDWVRIQREQVQLFIDNKDSAEFLSTGLGPDAQPVAGFCKQIPNSVKLDIFYAEQGRVDGEPILQIIGAQVKYKYEDWHLTCGSSDYPSVCRPPSTNKNTSTDSVSQGFFIHTKVVFTLVPRDWASQISGSANFSRRRADRIATTQACPYDACWREAFYAWTVFPQMFGSEFSMQNAYQIAISLGLGGLVFGMLLITRPFV
ncbi:hypothetical protein FGIG_06986 [Fasciola gigantica]|uniref:Tectonic-1-3 N-terminal domain-containing protein n=1 Tax=Fasciola gigantica TaxID=46835 RepID=A0A504YAQ9_FASGI|nr:hypothetical protein FGIG_06986 [Fasciola gigantica]